MKNKCVLLVLLLLTSHASAALYDRSGGLIYDDVLNVTWFQEAKLRSGRESAGLRELMSRNFGLPTTLPRIMYRTDLVKMTDSGTALYAKDGETGTAKGQDAATHIPHTTRTIFARLSHIPHIPHVLTVRQLSIIVMTKAKTKLIPRTYVTDVNIPPQSTGVISFTFLREGEFENWLISEGRGH